MGTYTNLEAIKSQLRPTVEHYWAMVQKFFGSLALVINNTSSFPARN